MIVTLIMLAVITFMAVTFLALSRREAGAVRVSTDAITAQNASYSGVERVKAELLASILATTNIHSFDLLVSTNYINWPGYDTVAGVIGNGADPTNVNYQYPNGNPVTGNDALQNIANLQYDARVPVVVTNRRFANSNEFRFYLDLNRNGRYDTNGYLPVIGSNGLPMVTFSNGIPSTNFSHFVGDPEWRGVLARPEFPHSATNPFLARYATIVVPTGKTLDLNFAHNQAKQPNPNSEGFFRNQGVGTWEINLAAFLADLNTNLWLVPPSLGGYGVNMTAPYYRYSTAIVPASMGAAFDDAWSLVYYRYAYNYRNSLVNLQGAFGPATTPALALNFVDDYSGGPLMTNYWGLNAAFDPDATRISSPLWRYFGSESPNHYFTTQDLFDGNKVQQNTGYDFVERLKIAGTNTSSYDRYTYYRLLAQLGTDSSPEPAGKLHLNYKNTDGYAVSNFVGWATADFFTNAANALLSRYTEEWLGLNELDLARRVANSNLYFGTYRTNQPFGIESIPVRVNSNFVYTPSVHRLLQMAANIADSLTNRAFASGSAYQYPSVFRPVFRKKGDDLFVVGYREVEQVNPPSDPQLVRPIDLNDPTDYNGLPENVDLQINVYGVPWVIGAKKGFPNFNEFAMQSIFQITRKLEIRRPSMAAPSSAWRTNMMYLVGITNVIGVEAWNSYQSNYSRGVDIYLDNELTMVLTNNYWPTGIRTNLILRPQTPGYMIAIPATGPQQWKGFIHGATNSFLVALRTNAVFIPDAAYHANPPRFVADYRTAWDTSQSFVQPQWGLSISNKFRFLMVDQQTGRVVDYVQLDGLIGQRDLSAEIRDEGGEESGSVFTGLWRTNLMAGGLPEGIANQIMISLGIGDLRAADWRGHDIGAHSTKDFEIDYFRALYGLPGYKYQGLANTNLEVQVPFTPTKRISQYLTWQANDPLIHYTSGDLASLPIADSLTKHSLKLSVQSIKNIGQLNDRYAPWGGNPLKGQTAGTSDPYNLALKDPGVSKSDDWQFPTNKYPNIGWLGRVHRGTPWQTVYLKSAEILTAQGGLGAWTNWTGNNTIHYLDTTNNIYDAARSVPESDRLLFDVFTTAMNENATRGQLSINQTNLAAWSALFSGVVALTNASTDAELTSARPTNRFGTVLLNPAGLDGTNSPMWKLVDGINRRRDIRNPNGTQVYPGQAFKTLGDILSVPELSTNSPFLNLASGTQLQKGINDAVYEWLPQQVMGLLRTGEPRFVVYSYGQTLRPARSSLYQVSGPFRLMCTNYQVTAEVATRTVLRVDGSPDPAHANHPDPARRYPPHIVVESFNLLPPD